MFNLKTEAAFIAEKDIITASELVGHGQEFGHELVSESEADGIIEKYQLPSLARSVDISQIKIE